MSVKKLILGLLFAAVCQADVIFNNITGDTSLGSDGVANTTLNSFPFNTKDVLRAVAFTPSANYVVIDAKALLDADPNFADSSVTASVFSDQNGLPSSLLGTIDTLSINSLATYTFTPSNPISLQAGNQYWLVLEATPASAINWITAASGTLNATKIVNNGSVGPWTVVTNNPAQFAIDGAASVTSPEPASLALVGAALVGVYVFGRKRFTSPNKYGN